MKRIRQKLKNTSRQCSRTDQTERRVKKEPEALLLEMQGATGATRDQSESENSDNCGAPGPEGRSPVRVDERAGIPLHVLGKLQSTGGEPVGCK